MLRRALATIVRHQMFGPGARLGVAVSGGADSVCLLHLLTELGRTWNLSLHVLHANHKLRAAESDLDAAFVAELAAGLRLPARILEAPPAPGNLEQAARDARRGLLFEARTALSLDAIAQGHTRSDQAETVLFRFLRGSGSAGLAGIRPKTPDGLVRPLIEIPREDVRGWLRAQGLPWREDSTNAGAAFARNRIRHGLLPQLERQWNPALESTLAHAAECARDEEDYWTSILDRAAGQHLRFEDRAVVLSATALAALPPALARRLVRRAIQHARGALRRIDFTHVESVLALARRPGGYGRVALPGLAAARSFDWLRIAPPAPSAAFRIPLDVPGRARGVSLDLLQSLESGYNGSVSLLDWRLVSGPLELRSWQPGDRFRPVGRTAPEKLKTLFQKARIPEWERHGWPVISRGDSIVWARRFGPAAEFAATPDTRLFLKIGED